MAGAACAQRRRDDARWRARCRASAAICDPTARPGRSTGWSSARPASPRSRSTDGSIRSARGSASPAAPASIPTIRRTWWPGSPASPAPAAQIKPWHAKGDVTLRADRIAVERLRTEIERGAVEGSVSYTWPAGDRPARLDGRSARGRARPRWRDRLRQVGAVRAGLERPGEVALAIEIGRARIAGLDARNIAARLTLDAERACHRAAVDRRPRQHQLRGHRPDADAVGSPGGSITVDLDARDLNGIVALAEKFAPALAEPLRRLAARQKTATLQRRGQPRRAAAPMRASGKIEPDRPDRRRSRQCLRERHRQARGVHGDGSRRACGHRCPDRRPARGRRVRPVAGAARPRPDRSLPSSKPARLDVQRDGPLGRDLRFEGKLDAGPIDAERQGHAPRFAADQPTTLELDQFAGTIGGNKVQGRLALRFGDAPRDRRHRSRPNRSMRRRRLRPRSACRRSAARARRLVDRAASPGARPGLTGRIEFKAQRAVFAPGWWRSRLRGVARFDGSEVVFEDVTGEIGNGRLEGRLAVANGGDGLSARVRSGCADAEPGAMFAGAERPAMPGRLSLQTELEGAGRSPAAFIGSLAGFGTITLEQAQLVGLNPGVFGAVNRAVELGIPTERQPHPRIRHRRARQRAACRCRRRRRRHQHQRRAGALTRHRRCSRPAPSFRQRAERRSGRRDARCAAHAQRLPPRGGAQRASGAGRVERRAAIAASARSTPAC